jgi:hypothetical protein
MNRLHWLVKTGFLMGTMLVSSMSSTPAEVIYSGSTDGAWQSGAASNRLAQTFRTGASGMTLDSVGVWVRNANESNSSASPGTLTISLFATDGAKKPTGTSLLTIVNSQSVGAWGDGWITGTSLNHSLSANTDYAVVFAASAGSTISWKYASVAPVPAITSSITPTPTFYNWQSSDNGGSWSDAAPTTGFNMVVQATVVPEPPQVVMLGAAGVSMAVVMGVRRRSARHRISSSRRA